MLGHGVAIVDAAMIAYPAPQLVQGSDIDILVRFSEIVAPGLLRRDDRPSPDDRLWIWVEGGTHSEELQEFAYGWFRVLLGLLRAWRTQAGELREEADARRAYGGPVRDDRGNMWVLPVGALGHAVVCGDIERVAANARDEIDASTNLRDALWLNGRPHCTAAEYLMIRDFACKEFGGPAKAAGKLRVTQGDLRRIKLSANNLSPLLGGRHVEERHSSPWSLDEQQTFTARLLRNWIGRGHNAP